MRRAFTIVELLVVVAIISLLLALVLPSLGRAKEIARRASCASSLNQMMVGMTAYAGNNRGWTPNWPGRTNSPGSINDGVRNVQYSTSGPLGVGKLIVAGYIPEHSDVLYCPSRVRDSRYGPDARSWGWSNWATGATVEYSYQHRLERRMATSSPDEIYGADLGIMDYYQVGSAPSFYTSVGADVAHGEQFYNVSYFDVSVRTFIDVDEELETSAYFNRPGRVLNTMEDLDDD